MAYDLGRPVEWVQRHAVISALVLGWLAGAIGVPAFLIVAFVGLCLYRNQKVQERKKQHLRIELQNAMSDPKVAIDLLGDELPPWVSFPRNERSAWFNMMMEQLWPSMCVAMHETLVWCLDPLLEAYMPAFLTKLKMSNCNLGPVPLRVLGVQGLTETGNSTVVDMHVAWAGNPDIRLVAGMSLVEVEAVIDEFSLKGILRMEFGPHCDKWPCFAAISFAFIGTPQIEFTLKAMKVPLDAIPGLAGWVDTFVKEYLFHFMVFPRRYVWPMVLDVEQQTATAVPKATLSLSIKSAEGLPKKMFQESESKVLGNVTSAPKESETIVAKGSNPDYESKRMTFTLLGSPDERLVLTCVGRFGTIGKIQLFTSRLIEAEAKQEFNTRIVGPDPAKNVGKIKFTAEVLPLTPYAASVESLPFRKGSIPGVILIHIVSAAKLPQVEFLGALSRLAKVGRSSCNYYVKCSVGRISVRSWASAQTRDPVYGWHETLDFRDVRTDTLLIEVCTREVAKDHVAATASVPLAEITAANGKYRNTLYLEPEGEVVVELGLLIRAAPAAAANGEDPMSPALSPAPSMSNLTRADSRLSSTARSK